MVIEWAVLLRIDGLPDPQESQLHVDVSKVGSANPVIGREQDVPLSRPQQVIERTFNERLRGLLHLWVLHHEVRVRQPHHRANIGIAADRMIGAAAPSVPNGTDRSYKRQRKLKLRQARLERSRWSRSLFFR